MDDLARRLPRNASRSAEASRGRSMVDADIKRNSWRPTMKKSRAIGLKAVLAGALAIGPSLTAGAAVPEEPHERPIKIAAFGTLTGPVRSFGINSRAALEAAAGIIRA